MKARPILVFTLFFIVALMLISNHAFALEKGGIHPTGDVSYSIQYEVKCVEGVKVLFSWLAYGKKSERPQGYIGYDGGVSTMALPHPDFSGLHQDCGKPKISL